MAMHTERDRRRSMMDRAIRWSVDNRVVVVGIATALTAWGAIVAARMPVDVFPDLTAPTVTVITEAHGLAPEEVETLVTGPIESAVNGAIGVRRVRSASGVGISLVWVELEWGTDLFLARQIVGERLQLARDSLPPGVDPPTLAPVSSIMGEILFIALKSDRHSPLEVRDAADWTVRKRLVAIAGVAQVIPIGGGVKQLQIEVEPSKLQALGVTVGDVMEAVAESNQSATGGFLVRGDQESLIRGVGRLRSKEDVEETVVALRDGVPIRVRQVATVGFGAAPKRGEGSSSAVSAVIMSVLKQPGANTLELTRRIDQELAAVQRTLPPGMKIDTQLFRQADFIETSLRNVATALRDGAILVAVVLFLFLLNVRTTLISLAAVPVSLIVTVLAMKAAGTTINTMTLGGLTIAIGALVDDAIIDVENVFRRLRENRERPEGERRPAADVIYEASREVRASIVFATVIVMLVFVPLFFLSGVEGRLLRPLGLAYIVAIFASLVVALTLTPALCALLMPNARVLGRAENRVIRGLKSGYLRLLRPALAHPGAVVGTSAALLAVTLALLPFLGRTFLPPFNEGALTIGAVTLPGTSLDASDRLGRRLEEVLLRFPEVVSTARRTGHAELDEHAQEVNASEIDVRLRSGGRPHEELLAAMRLDLAAVPGMAITIGQPISHRIDHMLSGTRANIAVKVFGEDLAVLRSTAEEIRRSMAAVPGVVDLAIEQQVNIPHLDIAFDREKIARHGLRAGALAELVEAVYAGHAVTRVLEGTRSYEVVVRYPEAQRADVESVRNTLIDAPSGGKIPLKMLADIREDSGPSVISRENVQRKMVVMANVAGRDLGGVVDDIRERVDGQVKLPAGYFVVYGGQFESEAQAARTIALLGGLVIAAIFLLLFLAFGSGRRALLVMANLPLALIGGVVAVHASGGVLSVASLIGFITLFGIATRNGIMLVSHYDHLVAVEGAPFDEAVERGSVERLAPVLMTALCAGLALIPLVLAGGRPGNEIQAPMGVVILGGLLSSTALNMLVVPALYRRFCR